MRDPKVITGALALLVAAVAVAGAAASGSAPTAGSPYKVVGTFGKTGTGNGQLSSNTHGLVVDKSGNVYVADTDNHRVQVFSAGGAFLRKWGSIGEGNGQFDVAEDIDIAPDGTVAVADQQNSRIQLFSSGGAFKASISTGLDLPRGVASGDDGTVYAAIEGSDRGGLKSWASPTAAGSGLFAGASFMRPDDVEVAPDGTLFFVANGTQGATSSIRHVSATGAPLGAFAGLGTTGIGVDSDCNVWMANRNARRIEKHTASGRLLTTASSPDLVANDIAVSPGGDLYVIHQNVGIIHFAENKASPRTAGVPATISAKGGTAKIAYAASFSCPAQVSGVATLSGGGVSGKAVVDVAAGKVTPITMKVKAPAGKTKATFKIVLKTNGRPTTETKNVVVAAK
jgi:sugar lactone lactonase YvrE